MYQRKETVKWVKTVMAAVLMAAVLFTTLSGVEVSAATGSNPVAVSTGWLSQKWTRVCTTSENYAQYIRIEALYPVNLDVRMKLSNGKYWTEACAVKVKNQGMCVRDFYVGANVKWIEVRVNKNSITHYGTKATVVQWKKVGRILYN